MQKYHKLPLLFLVIAAGIGLFLRWQFIHPTPGVKYTYFLHGHSHVMFLGWVFNVLYIFFVDHHIGPRDRGYRKLFVALQALVVAMMISFPLQGYGLYSIIFSTAHTLASMGFIVAFFRDTNGRKSASLWFARASLLFFFISTAGPFSLGYLMANALGGTVWYNFSIYYYLHFQYNGFFLFGIFSLFYQLLEEKKIPFDVQQAIFFGKLLAAACIPAYTLSILFADPGPVFNAIGAMAAALQLFALWKFAYSLRDLTPWLQVNCKKTVRIVLAVVLLALIAKSILQLLSAHPAMARLAWELRPVVIAYLHLVLVGVITFFLMAWYMERDLVRERPGWTAMSVLFVGFVGSEICLVMLPWWSRLTPAQFPPATVIIFAFSVLLLLGVLMFYLSSATKTDENQSFR